MFHIAPVNMSIPDTMYIDLLPIDWLSTDVAKLDTAATMNGTPVKATVPTYEVLNCVATTVFVVT